MFEQEITKVNITGLTLLKIMKHAKESKDVTISGQLQGIMLKEEPALEVTYSYPWPAKEEAQMVRIQRKELFDQYASELTKKIEDTQIDNFQIGWYIVSQKKDHLFYDNFQAHYDFQKKIPFAILLVLDLQDQQKGNKVPFKFLKIQNKLMDILKKCENESGIISVESIQALNLKFDKIYEEIPFQIQNSPLDNALLNEYQSQIFKDEEPVQANIQNNLENNIQLLLDSLTELDEQQINLNDQYLNGQKNKSNVTSLTQHYEADHFMDILVSINRVKQFIQQNENYGQMIFQTDNLLNILSNQQSTPN